MKTLSQSTWKEQIWWLIIKQIKQTWAIGEARFKSNADWYEHELSYIFLFVVWRICMKRRISYINVHFKTRNSSKETANY